MLLLLAFVPVARAQQQLKPYGADEMPIPLRPGAIEYSFVLSDDKGRLLLCDQPKQAFYSETTPVSGCHLAHDRTMDELANQFLAIERDGERREAAVDAMWRKRLVVSAEGLTEAIDALKRGDMDGLLAGLTKSRDAVAGHKQ